MTKFTLADIQCFDAVVREGSFQAAANTLNRTHPTIFAAVTKLESQLGFSLLDRTGYRVSPTGAGLAFHQRTQRLLQEVKDLQTFAQQLALGVEPLLRVVIGDLAPLQQVLKLLGNFFNEQKNTRLELGFEAVTGPWERLFDDDAEMMIHRIDKTDTRLEWIDLAEIKLVPVVAPNFLRSEAASLSLNDLRSYTQCIIRDTARHTTRQNYFIIDGANQCTVADHKMKKEIIMQGMAWGHLPHHMIDKELKQGKLLTLSSSHFTGITEDLVIARRKDRAHGPVANKFWEYVKKEMSESKLFAL